MTEVVSPALTPLPSKANFALRRKVSQRPRAVVNSSPWAFWILNSVITSTSLAAAACTVPTETMNNTVNTDTNNDSKNLVFANFFIMDSPFFIE